MAGSPLRRDGAGIVLWFLLVFPSLFVVDKYLGWQGLLAYATCAALAIRLAPRLPKEMSRPKLAWLAFGTALLVVIVFLAVYPVVNTHVPGHGSDDDDAYNLGAAALMAGRSPYILTTYLGNVLHALPGAFVLAAPFVLLGTSALQNIFWLGMFFFAVAKETGDRPYALSMAWLTLALSPNVAHQIVTGTGHMANAIYVLLGLWWLISARFPTVAAVAWGVTLASRANFLFLVPLACGWLWRHEGWRAALGRSSIAVATAACLSLPFYLHDPANFGPLEAANRLTRFDTLLPHADVLIVIVMGTIAIGLSLTRMHRSALFRNCAIVQAVPVAAGVILSTVQNGRPDLGFAAYGTFFVWFGLMAIAAWTRY